MANQEQIKTVAAPPETDRTATSEFTEYMITKLILRLHRDKISCRTSPKF
jgi:hypothetical protein